MSWSSSHIWRCFLSSHASLSPLSLTTDEIKQCLQLVQAHRTPQALARRAQIVLAAHAHPDWSSQRIAQFLDLNDRLVRKWRRRWLETHSLTDLPRPGAPRCFSSEARAQVTALACSLPRSHGVPLAHWSRAELARQVSIIDALPTISARTIGRWPDFRGDPSPSGFTPGNTSRSRRPSCNGRVQCCGSMNTLSPSYKKASGWSVLMRKRRFKHERQNKLLVLPSQIIPCTSHLAIIDVE